MNELIAIYQNPQAVITLSVLILAVVLFISGLLAGCGGATKIWALLGAPAIFILIISH